MEREDTEAIIMRLSPKKSLPVYDYDDSVSPTVKSSKMIKYKPWEHINRKRYIDPSKKAIEPMEA